MPIRIRRGFLQIAIVSFLITLCASPAFPCNGTQYLVVGEISHGLQEEIDRALGEREANEIGFVSLREFESCIGDDTSKIFITLEVLEAIDYQGDFGSLIEQNIQLFLKNQNIGVDCATQRQVVDGTEFIVNLYQKDEYGFCQGSALGMFLSSLSAE